MQQLKVIISGGGTGGHIFPAIAIANAIKKLMPGAKFLFVGAEGKMEMQRVPDAGYEIVGLWISGFQRRLTWQNILFPIKLVVSLFKARGIIKRFKPDVVVGTGGFASGPLLQAATSMKIPALIQEQNSYAGITNKILSKRVDKVCVAYEGMERFFPREKIIMTGNPVRSDIVNLEGKTERAREFFALPGYGKTLLVIGGSLGARTINQCIATALPDLAREEIRLIWQTGRNFLPQAEEAVKASGIKNVFVSDFITRMDFAYALADLVVSRAGASSVSELCIVRKPSILVPSPNVAEDHQTRNAEALANHHAAVLVKDSSAQTELKDKIIELFRNQEELEKLADNISKLAFTDAAEVIATEVIRLAGTKRK